MSPSPRSESELGVAAAVGAHLMWGMFPIFFGLLAPAGAVEILAHRMLWTLLVMLMIGALLHRLSRLRTLTPKATVIVAGAALMISVNWGTYIYGVLSGRVVETALGYFVNPLVSVLLGMIVFRERVNRWQAAALALAAVAVLVLTLDYGRPPWIALVLALSFGAYALLKKVVPLDPVTSLTAEGVVTAPFAIGYLVFLSVTGTGTFVGKGAGHTVLLMAAGVVTAVPLLLFGAAAKRVPLVALGIIQYLTPSLQMLWGVAVLHEDMPGTRWAGFALIWLALLIFTTDAVRRVRRSRREVLIPAR
ncbi:chloramphenicol-sensitive protein RarD [Rhodococcus maanshanensis]|uniref:Chloramphenicol-sensitive protein RarD n=2 Tax=Rhodococcus maanshanensis TaxID=183556 RepID=A0A1H7SV23_9NOCA|nr:EamA family transporter RarD [Rhodococcus maanshanensis]SEL76421.1 chloramphenicol-sensitive protein RarD [Rhodococcus maanshanensis]